jgi:hypothetical protein
MYFRDDIIITGRGLRIRAKALNPVGIADESVCWGIAVPPAPNEENRTPDLLISAFHPKSWHILFKLTIELIDEPGVLLRVLKLINDEKKQFNILSTQCAPSGYKHATWNIIGEALDDKNEIEKPLERAIEEDFFKDIDAFADANEPFRKRLTRTVSGRMLRYGYDLENLLLNEDKLAKNNPQDEVFLKRINRDNTLLFSFDDDLTWFSDSNAPDIAAFERFKMTLPQSVQVRWLQQLATYRIYNHAQKNGKLKNPTHADVLDYLPATWDSPLRFKYDATHSFLEPQSESDKTKFREIVSKCVTERESKELRDFPIRTIAAFNPDEDFFRVSLPNRDRKNNRLSIQVDYRVTLGNNSRKSTVEDISSIGLLEKVTEKISDKLNLRYISNSLLSYSTKLEKGRITIVGGTKYNQEITDTLRAEIKAQIMAVDEARPNVKFEASTVNKYGAKRIFVSTRLAFLEDDKPKFKNALHDLVNRYGFEMILIDGQAAGQFDGAGNSIHNLEHEIAGQLSNCDAFLQIYPKLWNRNIEKDRDWLLYELGFARGRNIPYAICIDEGYVKEYPNQVIEGKRFYTYRSSQDTDVMMLKIERAVKSLSDFCYG